MVYLYYHSTIERWAVRSAERLVHCLLSNELSPTLRSDIFKRSCTGRKKRHRYLAELSKHAAVFQESLCNSNSRDFAAKPYLKHERTFQVFALPLFFVNKAEGKA